MPETEKHELKEGENHLKRGRWYPWKGHEIAVLECTIRGVVIKLRPRIDKNEGKKVG